MKIIPICVLRTKLDIFVFITNTVKICWLPIIFREYNYQVHWPVHPHVFLMLFMFRIYTS
jgi:hypothetical protein